MIAWVSSLAAPRRAPRFFEGFLGKGVVAATAGADGSIGAIGGPPSSSSTAGGGPASADSYSPTVAKTGNPAEAARARVAGSPAMIDSLRLLTIASRDSSRKFIRDVEIREPYGTTRPTFGDSEDRIRDAADVISSSTSR
jgi:hypothetical protein